MAWRGIFFWVLQATLNLTQLYSKGGPLFRHISINPLRLSIVAHFHSNLEDENDNQCFEMVKIPNLVFEFQSFH